jgi:copper homeostasis protein
MLLEVIAFNLESCLIAERSGAHRIELCDNPGEGGTTPSYGMIRQARKQTTIALFPIIRPRGGDFVYSDDEFDIMKADLSICKTLGCDGVVLGLLDVTGNIDVARTRELVRIAYPMSVTFHRAFDRANDPTKALEDVIACGCERVLTSGQHETAYAGIQLINELIVKADERIIIMPGSGVRSDNIAEIATKTGAKEFHSSARKSHPGISAFSPPTMNEAAGTVLLDEEEVKKLLEAMPSSSK